MRMMSRAVWAKASMLGEGCCGWDGISRPPFSKLRQIIQISPDYLPASDRSWEIWCFTLHSEGRWHNAGAWTPAKGPKRMVTQNSVKWWPCILLKCVMSGILSRIKGLKKVHERDVRLHRLLLQDGAASCAVEAKDNRDCLSSTSISPPATCQETDVHWTMMMMMMMMSSLMMFWMMRRRMLVMD